jgi:octaprenyl-diphosphate synthase
MDLLEKLKEKFQKELEELEKVIHAELRHDIPIIQDIFQHIVSSGGKRFRPLLLIASTAFVGGSDFKTSAKMGAAVEMIHTATLLHDDVVDESDLRRGKKTANHVFGNTYSILAGDYLFTKSFNLLIENNRMEILNIVSKAFMAIVEGEVLQMTNISNFQMDVETNLQIMTAKTGKLISAACEIGAIVGGAEESERKALAQYGQYLGVLFQIADDILDYVGDPKTLGKPIGGDFSEGKMTLPLIYALEEKRPETFEDAVMMIEKNHGIEKTIDFAKDIQKKALGTLEIFPESEIRQFFEELTYYSLNRKI